jgi:hypothetical protein
VILCPTTQRPDRASLPHQYLQPWTRSQL